MLCHHSFALINVVTFREGETVGKIGRQGDSMCMCTTLRARMFIYGCARTIKSSKCTISRDIHLPPSGCCAKATTMYL